MVTRVSSAVLGDGAVKANHIALGGCVLASLAGALLGTAVWIHRLPPEQWHWMQQAELERRRSGRRSARKCGQLHTVGFGKHTQRNAQGVDARGFQIENP